MRREGNVAIHVGPLSHEVGVGDACGGFVKDDGNGYAATDVGAILCGGGDGDFAL